MKLFYVAASIVVLILLQACSSPSVKGSKASVVNEKAGSGNMQVIRAAAGASVTQNRDNDSLGNNQSLAVPEAQIIRELYQSGCIIEDIEINRRKQQMRISCANDKPFGSSI